MGLEAVLPGPQNALYVMLCYQSVTLISADVLASRAGTSRIAALYYRPTVLILSITKVFG